MLVSFTRTTVLGLGAFLALGALAAEASNVLHMNLRDLVARADRIVRGTVLESEEGTLAIGNGVLPIVRYRIRVEETLKGGASVGDVIEVRLLGQIKPTSSGRYRRASVLRDLPQFTVGRDYLFVLTRPSSIGLSTTVGLGQGLFRVAGHPGDEQAVNEAHNLGLFRGIQGAPQAPGPVPYATLVKQIRTLVQ